MKAYVKNVYEGLNARSKVYLSKEYFFKMYPNCVSSKLCEFIEDWIGNLAMATLQHTDFHDLKKTHTPT